jgi:hypothetical protein
MPVFLVTIVYLSTYMWFRRGFLATNWKGFLTVGWTGLAT